MCNESWDIFGPEGSASWISHDVGLVSRIGKSSLHRMQPLNWAKATVRQDKPVRLA